MKPSNRKFPWLYLLLAYGLSWIFWIPVALTRQDYQESPLLLAVVFLGVFGPGIAGIFLIYREQGREGGRDFWRRVFDFRRISLKWYALMLLLFPALHILSIAINIGLGGDPPQFVFIKEATAMPAGILTVTLFYLLQSALEELGWRGYMLDRLQAIWKPTVASLVLGVFHAFWHLPLFWIVGTNQSRYLSIPAFVLFVAFVTSGSFYNTWCYNDNHRSILAVILFHTFTNLALDTFLLPGTGEYIYKIVTVVGAVLIAITWNLPERKHRRLLSITLLVILSAGCVPNRVQPSITNPQTAVPGTSAALISDPYAIISEESLLLYLEDLTSIQPYSGWRNSASSGEAEALDYVEGKLKEFSRLQGMELERQSFNVYVSTEIWDSRLVLTVGSQEIEVPADALRGPSKMRFHASYFDSDGSLGDLDHDPLLVDGDPIVVLEAEDLYTLRTDDIKDRILLLDYALIDTVTNEDAILNTTQLISLVDQGLAGVVLVTQYSNQPGQSRGIFISEAYNFVFGVPSRRVPMQYVRLEDLAPAGIKTWDDLRKIQSAHLVTDTDVLSPGVSGNLIAHIPGVDSSAAVILGAHIDSANGPGGFDDGSGSASLLEVARALNVSQVRPPADLYLVWFGSHEIGTYGSAHFAATHQDVLDRTAAVMIMDGLGHPMDGRKSNITMEYTPYGKFGDERMPLYELLSESVASQGLVVDHMVVYGLIADNSNFDAFDAPNVALGYENAREAQTQESGYYHYANHWHDAYETVDRVREMGEAFVAMTKVMLSTALEADNTRTTRVTPLPTHRALIVASHTQMENVPTSMLREVGMALAWEGFDVDMVPYGQAFTSSDLKNVELIVLPPTLDYPGNKDKWSAAEFKLLDAYVAEGGFLVVTNSRCGYASKFCLDDTNEDTRALNPFLEPMGVKFKVVGFGSSLSNVAYPAIDHPLTTDAGYITFYEGQGVAFDMVSGTILFQAAGNPLVGLVDYGNKGGQVLLIADLGILQADAQGSKNMEFMKNIATYATER